MKEQSQTPRWRARALAIVAIVGIMLVPVCVPTCGANTCHAGEMDSAKAEPCHGQRATGKDVSPSTWEAVKTCGLAELPAAVLHNGHERLQEKGSAVAQRIAIVGAEQFPFLPGLDGTRGRYGAGASYLALNFLESIVLRI